MARAFEIYGEPDAVRAEVERAWSAADSMLIAAPSWGIPLDRVDDYTEQIKTEQINTEQINESNRPW